MFLLEGPAHVTTDVAEKEGKDKGDGMIMIRPSNEEECVGGGQEREPPRDPVDDDLLCVGGGELVDDGAKKEGLDDGPSEEGPDSWGEVSLLEVPVDRLLRRGDNADV